MNSNQSQKRVTVRDIATRLKISHTTVSRALHDDRRISHEVRNAVSRAAEAMGYRPDPMLSALAHYRRSTADRPISSELAWINAWPEPKKLRTFKEFDLYWRSAFDEAARSGFRLEEFVINDEMTPARLKKILQARNIQGILIPPHGESWNRFNDFNWDNYCVVRFGYTVTQPFHVVTSSQLTDGMIAFQNMWRMGYRRIGLVCNPRMLTRFGAGYLFAQWQENPKIQVPPLVFENIPDDENRSRALKTWLGKYRPDAILTDVSAMRSLLKKIGYSVPGDVGLAAFSVLDGGADAGIDQRSDEIGCAAIQLLISLINHNQRGIPNVYRELLISGRWVDGKTLPAK